MFSVWFNGVRSWEDLYLVPTSRPCAAPPQVKTNFVDIPGGNGSLDLTEALTGSPLYSDRSGSVSFIVLRKNLCVSVWDEEKGVLVTPDLSALDDEGRTGDGTESQMYWMHRYQDIMSRIHGKKGALVFSEDPLYFYKGRFAVSEWESGELYSTVTIEYIASPFKYPTEHLDLYYSRELEQYGVL